jgi:hypothetical protein|tara:strand:- start:1251 stop:2927 length:1677 start_codon:yes stop_codon:yes gene_type:complete
MSLSISVYGFMTLTGSQTAGRWATAEITAETGADTMVYEVPNVGVDYMILAVSITNQNAYTASNVSFAVSQDATPRGYEFLEYRSSLVPSGTLERTQIVASAGDKIYVRWGIPVPRNDLRILDNAEAGSVIPMGMTVMPDNAVVAADSVGSAIMYMRNIDAAGVVDATAQYTLATSNAMLAPSTSATLDVTMTTTDTDTFYEFNAALQNTQNEGFEYTGASGYEDFVTTDLRVDGTIGGTNTFPLYKTASFSGSSGLWTSNNTLGDIETGISVVWPGAVDTGQRVKLFTTDNGTDTMFSIGYVDSGTSSRKQGWCTAFNGTTKLWDSFLDQGAEDAIPVGIYYWAGYVWTLFSDGYLVQLDASDGTIESEFTLAITDDADMTFGNVDTNSRLFYALGNTLYFTSSRTTEGAAKYVTYLWKYTIGTGVRSIKKLDTQSGTTGVYTPRFLVATSDRIYLQLQANYEETGVVQNHSYLYDILDSTLITADYNDGVKTDTLTTVDASNYTQAATTVLFHSNNAFNIPYPTDVSSDLGDVATSPLGVNSDALPEIRELSIDAP